MANFILHLGVLMVLCLSAMLLIFTMFLRGGKLSLAVAILLSIAYYLAMFAINA